MTSCIKDLKVTPLEGDGREKLRQIASDLLPVANGDGKANFKAVRRERDKQLRQIEQEFSQESLEFKFAEKLSQTSPTGFGICRGQEWWKLMLQIFTFEEAMERYLKQLVRSLTKAEHDSLGRYLVVNVGLDVAAAGEILAKFKIKPKAVACQPKTLRHRERAVW